MTLTILKDMQSVKNCLNLVCIAYKVYDKEPVVTVMLSTMVGNSGAFLLPVPRLARGTWSPGSSEFLHPKL